MVTSRLAQRQRLVARAVIGRWVTGALARSLHRWSAAAADAAADRYWLLACSGAGPGPAGSPGGRRAAARPGAAVEAAVEALMTVVAGVWERADAAAAAAVAEAMSIFRSIDTDGSGTLTGLARPPRRNLGGGQTDE